MAAHAACPAGTENPAACTTITAVAAGTTRGPGLPSPTAGSGRTIATRAAVPTTATDRQNTGAAAITAIASRTIRRARIPTEPAAATGTDQDPAITPGAAITTRTPGAAITAGPTRPDGRDRADRATVTTRAAHTACPTSAAGPAVTRLTPPQQARVTASPARTPATGHIGRDAASTTIAAVTDERSTGTTGTTGPAGRTGNPHPSISATAKPARRPTIAAVIAVTPATEQPTIATRARHTPRA